MKHIVPTMALFTLLVLMIYSNVSASASSMFNVGFGGKIISTKAAKIEILENAGFICTVPGSTITVNQVDGKIKSYLIPAGTSSRTKGKIKRIGQWILGLFGKTETVSIPCVQEETGATETVILPVINMYGTSL